MAENQQQQFVSVESFNQLVNQLAAMKREMQSIQQKITAVEELSLQAAQTAQIAAGGGGSGVTEERVIEIVDENALVGAEEYVGLLKPVMAEMTANILAEFKRLLLGEPEEVFNFVTGQAILYDDHEYEVVKVLADGKIAVLTSPEGEVIKLNAETDDFSLLEEDAK